jgi:hypothetical protein
MNWTDEEFMVSKELIEIGKTYEEIARKLDRSVASVRNKLIKNGYSREKYLERETKSNCLNCDVEFSHRKRKRVRKFCCKSCSAIYNNNKKVVEGKQEKISLKISQSLKERKNKPKNSCLNCDKEIIRNTKKYCNDNCVREKRWKDIVYKIENNISGVNFRNHKKYLIEKYGDNCMKCGWCEKNPMTDRVPIELEHIDGNSKNNNLDNLELLCPNCHSLTPTYKSLNKGNGRYSRSERYRNGKSY